MKKTTSRVLATLITSIFTLMALVIPVSAEASKDPYVRSWLDAMGNYMVVDYYEYLSNEGAYMKTSTVQYIGTNAYYKTSSFKLTENLYDEQIGFDIYGNVIFIDTSYQVYVCLKNSKNMQVAASNVRELTFDNNGFVVNNWNNSGNSNYNNSGNNGNSGYNNNNGNGNSGNSGYYNNNGNGNSGNSGYYNNNGNGNSGNSGYYSNGNGNSSNYNNYSNSKYPYIAVEDGMLTYVEASDLRHVLYVENNHLMLNNLILYKHGVKAYAFTKDGVVYITNESKLVYLKFGTKKQYVKAKKVSSLQYDNSGFCIGYTTSSGKSYSL